MRKNALSRTQAVPDVAETKAPVAHDYGVPGQIVAVSCNDHLPRNYASRASAQREMLRLANLMRMRGPAIDWERAQELRRAHCVDDHETLRSIAHEVTLSTDRCRLLRVRLRSLILAHTCPEVKKRALRNQRLIQIVLLLEKIRKAGFVGNSVRNADIASYGLQTTVCVRTIDRDMSLLFDLGAIERHRLKSPTEATVARKIKDESGSAPKVRLDCNLYLLSPRLNLPPSDDELEDFHKLEKYDSISRYAAGRGLDVQEYLRRSRSETIELRNLPDSQEILSEEQARRERGDLGTEGLHPWFHGDPQNERLKFQETQRLSKHFISSGHIESRHAIQRKKISPKTIGISSDLANAREKERQKQETSLSAVLKKFGYSSFRSGQFDLVQTGLVSDCLFVSPTGSGKSFVFQALGDLIDGLTVVVSPLVELMHDQVAKLKKLGFQAARFSPETAHSEAFDLGDLEYLYLSPEMFASKEFLKLAKGTQLGLLVVDEAHCVLEWGDDFRPCYRLIGGIRDQLEFSRVFACTATLRAKDATFLARSLGLDRSFKGCFVRPSKPFSPCVIECTSKKEKMVRVLQELRRSSELKSLVFASTRAEAEEVALEISSKGLKALAYHAGLPSEIRRDNARLFRTGSVDVLVCTSAYGMGIDQPDVNLVIHYSPPYSLEALIQQVGRGGRGDVEARSVCLWTLGDLVRARHLMQCSPFGRRTRWESLEGWLLSDGNREGVISSYFGWRAP